MGQRLVTTIYVDDERILNCYMHWTGYTRSTISTALAFAEKWPEYAHKPGMRKESAVLKCCLDAWKGSGVLKGDLPRLAALGFVGFGDGKKIEAIDRSEGLIAVSEAGMDDNERWVNVRLDIYVGKDNGLSFWTDAYFPDLIEGYSPYPVCDDKWVDVAVLRLSTGDSIDEETLRHIFAACNKAFDDKTYGFTTKSGLTFGMIA